MGRPVSTDCGVHCSDCASKSCGQQIQMQMQQQSTDRVIYLSGEVSEQLISGVISQLMIFASQSDDPISLVLSTYGGSVDEMFSLYDVVSSLTCPVHTIGLGKIMSAGVLLLAMGKKGKRLIGPSSRVMIHSISSFVYGNIFDVLNTTKEMKRQQKMMFNALLQETKMTKKQLEDIFNSKTDTYLTAQEAIKLGIADKLIVK
jgi:ATP-dependent Clp protease protease subunit